MKLIYLIGLLLSTHSIQQGKAIENATTTKTSIQIDSVESANSTQTNEDANEENKSTEQTNEDAIEENQSTERAARKMYIKMDKEADENEKKHRLNEGTGIGGRCTRHVLSSHTLEPSKYTVHSGSKWFPEHMCPDGTWVKKYQMWQDDSYWDQKGVIYVGLCCIPLAGVDSDCDSDSNWIWSGNTNDPNYTGKIVRKVGCCKDISCPNPSPRGKWVTGMRAFFKNSDVGMINLKIGCDEAPFVPGVGWSRPTVIGFTIAHFAIENNRDAESRVEFCDDDKNDRSKLQAICGFRLHGEEGGANNSGINKIKFFCCAVPGGPHGI